MVTRVGPIALLIAFALALFVGCGQHDTLPPPTPKANSSDESHERTVCRLYTGRAMAFF